MGDACVPDAVKDAREEKRIWIRPMPEPIIATLRERGQRLLRQRPAAPAPRMEGGPEERGHMVDDVAGRSVAQRGPVLALEDGEANPRGTARLFLREVNAAEEHPAHSGRQRNGDVTAGSDLIQSTNLG